MTSVSISTTKNTVTVDEDNPSIITVATQGPQGPAFADGDIGDIVISGGGTVATIDNGVVNNAKIASDAAIALSKLATGALPTGITVASANIPDLTIVNSDISASAAIALSKLATGALPTAITVTSANISDLSILNADVNASAGIAGTKISPDFGSQNIVTTGNITIADVTAASLDISGNADIDGTLEADAYTVNGTALNEYIADTVGAMVSGNTETNIAVTYDDADNTLDFSVVNITGNAASADTVDITGTNSNTNYYPLFGLEGSGATVYNDLSGNLKYNPSTNVLTAGTFSGSGASLTSLPASQLTGAIANGVTATTQSASDNSTKVATTAYADTAIANLVDSSPSALNTLNELAAALGDDANFSTTVTNSIATKLPLAGGTLTGTLELDGDLWLDASGTASRDVFWDSSESIFRFYNSAKATFGNSDDLQIYHDGSHSHIVNSTGNLRILADGAGDLVLTSKAGEEAIKCVQDGNVQLMYDNSKKLETTSTGVLVTELTNSGNTTFNGSYVTFSGTNTAAWDKSNTRLLFNDNAKAAFGTGVDLTIYHGGTNSIIENITGDLYFKNTNNFFLQVNASEAAIYARPNAAVELYYDASKKLETQSWGTSFTGNVSPSATNSYDLGASGAQWQDLWIGNDIHVADNGIAKFGNSGDLQIYHNATNSYIANSTGNLVIDNGSGVDMYINSGNDIYIRPQASENGITVTGDGDVSLYYDNSQKFHTRTDGVRILGDATWSDNGKARFGPDGDLQIYHNGTDNVIGASGGHTTKFYGPDFEIYSLDGTKTCAKFDTDNSVELYFNSSKKFETLSTGVSISGNLDADQIDLGDSQQLRFGAGQDLKLYHDGSNSYIEDSGTGQLILRTDSFRVNNVTNNENLISGEENGSVGLFYDDSKKLETISWGAKVTGNLEATGSLDVNEVTINGTVVLNSSRSLYNLAVLELADNIEARFGSSNDLKIYHDGTNSWIKEAGTNRLIIDTDGQGIDLTKTGATEYLLRTAIDGAVELYYDGAKKFETLSDGVKIDGILHWEADNTGRAIELLDNQKIFLGDGTDLQIYHDGTHSRIHNNTGSLLIECDGANVQINKGTSENMAVFTPDGAVELYYDNSLKARTQTWGFELFGNIHGDDNIQINLGTSNDLQIYHTGTVSVISHTGEGNLIIATAAGDTTYVDTSTFEVRNASSNETQIKATENAAVELYYDNNKKLETQVYGTSLTGNLFLTDSADHNWGRIKIGDGEDLQIYHDGSHSYISDVGTGYLLIKGSEVQIQSSTGEDMAKFMPDAAVELYYDNSKKFETDTNGVTVTGTLTTTSGINAGNNISLNDTYKIKFGNSDDLQIYHDGSHSYIADTGAGYLRIQAADYLQIGTASSAAAFLNCQATDGAVFINFNGSTKLETTSTGATVTGNFLPEADNTRNIGDGSTNFNSIWASTRFRGNDNVKLVLGNAQDLVIRHDGTDNLIESPTGDTLKIMMMGSSVDTADETAAKFVKDGTVELYYDNSKKFETYNNGVKVYNHLRVQGANDENAVINLYADNADDAADLWQIAGMTDGTFHINQWNGGSWENTIKVTGGGAVELFHDNSKKLETTSWGADVGGTLRADTLQLDGDDQKLQLGADQDWEIYHDGTDNYFQTGEVTTHFRTNNGNRLTIKSDGNVMMQGSSGKNLEFKVATGLLTFTDNTKATFGTGDDLQVYHDGSHSYIKNSTGNLYVNSGEINFSNVANNEWLARFIEDGACMLYYDNSKKLETTSAGAEITGELHVISSGTSHGLSVYKNSNLAAYLGHIGTGDEGYLSLRNGGTETINLNGETGAATFTGNVTTGELVTISGAEPRLVFTDTNNDPDFTLWANSSKFSINEGDGTPRFRIQSSGIVDIFGNLNCDAGVDVVGTLTESRESTDTNFYVKSLPATESGLYVQNPNTTNGTYSSIGIISKNSTSTDQSASIISKSVSGGYRPEVYITQRTNANANTAALFINTSGAVQLNYDGSSRLTTDSNGVLISTSAYFLAGASCQFKNSWNSNITRIRNQGANAANEGNLEFSTGADTIALTLDKDQNATFAGDISVAGDIKVGTAAGTANQYLKKNSSNQLAWESISPGSAGGANTIHMNDNVKLTFGDSTTPDLEILHSGSEASIKNKTGNLTITNNYNTGVINLNPQEGRKGIMIMDEGAVYLYYDAPASSPVAKFETTSSGAKVTGQLEITTGANSFITSANVFKGTASQAGAYIRSATSSAAYPTYANIDDTNTGIYFTGSDVLSFSTGGNNALSLDASQNATFAGDISLANNKKLLVGTDGSDPIPLQIYHNGAHSSVQNFKGNLHFAGQNVRLTNANFGEIFISCDVTDAVKLYGHGSSTPFFETKAYGTRTAGIHNISQATNDTDFTNESGPGFTNGLIAENTQATNGVWAALTALAYNAATTNQSASFIAKSVASGHAPEIHITQRTGSNAQTTALKIDSSQHATFTGSVQSNDFKGSSTDTCFYGNIADGNVGIYATNEDNSITLQRNTGAKILEAVTGISGGCKLYYGEATDPKCETYADGIKCFNHCRVEGGEGENATLALYADQADDSNDQFLITSTGSALQILGNYDNGWHRYLQVNPNAGVQLYYDAMDGSSPVAKLQTTSTGAKVTGSLGINTDPDQKLHVYESATNGQCYLHVQNNRSRNAAIKFTTTQGSWYVGQGIGTDTDKFMVYDDQERFSIDSNGDATFAGNIGLADDKILKIGANTDIELYHSGAWNYLRNGSGDNFVIQVKDTEGNYDNAFVALPEGATQLYYNGSLKAATIDQGLQVQHSGAETQLKLYRSDNVAVNNPVGRIYFIGKQHNNGSSASDKTYAYIETKATDTTVDSTNSELIFYTKTDGVDKAVTFADGGATFAGTVTAPSVASSGNGMRKMTTSTSAPSGGSDGDVWFKYTA